MIAVFIIHCRKPGPGKKVFPNLIMYRVVGLYIHVKYGVLLTWIRRRKYITVFQLNRFFTATKPFGRVTSSTNESGDFLILPKIGFHPGETGTVTTSAMKPNDP